MINQQKVFTDGWADYELIDAGGGKKLERFGDIVLIRPELQAYFRSGMPFHEWKLLAHWEFVPSTGQSGKWKALKAGAPREWTVKYGSLVFQLELTKFKHVGLFPEQKINWELVGERLGPESSCLNLFAYTGAMSCVARSAGSEILHVDSVKQLIGWASTNMELSKLMNIKWVHEDALKFIKRLVKRGSMFDVIVMDPPAWGVGAKNEKWKLEEKLEDLLASASKILSPEGMLILNTYSPKVDVRFIQELAEKYFSKRNFSVDELWMNSNSGKQLYFGNRLLVG